MTGLRQSSTKPSDPIDAATPRATLRMFAAARQAAGTARAEVRGRDVAAVLRWARETYGAEFGAVLDGSRVWCNGEPAEPSTVLRDGDEVAVLPPVSGGAQA